MATLIKSTSSLDLLSSTTLLDSYSTCTSVRLNSVIYHIYKYILIPQTDQLAEKLFTNLNAHIEGDLNCTLNPSLDRFCSPYEKRHKIASRLNDICSNNLLCDIWRNINPDLNKFTWHI